MPAVTRLGDMCTGHGCHPSRPNVGGSSNVFVNGIPAHRQSDHWPTHCCGDDCHDGVLAAGCPGVYVNGLELGRVGDPVSCGSHVAMGSGNVFAGETTDEEKFEALRDAIESKKPTQKEKLLLCLPDIAEAEAENAIFDDDEKGWSYLRSMFHKWFAGKGNANAEANPDVFWVDMEWILSYARARFAYGILNQYETLFSPEAQEALATNLKRDGLLTNRRTTFDYITQHHTRSPQDWWKAGYFQQVTAYGFATLYSDGLMAAMGNFTFRALAAGTAEPLPGGGHRITVYRVGIIVWDSFNFHGEYDLRYWSCEKEAFSSLNLNDDPSYTKLSNDGFQNFRSKYGLGNDFMVLSQPKKVENFWTVAYDTAL